MYASFKCLAIFAFLLDAFEEAAGQQQQQQPQCLSSVRGTRYFCKDVYDSTFTYTRDHSEVMTLVLEGGGGLRSVTVNGSWPRLEHVELRFLSPGSVDFPALPAGVREVRMRKSGIQSLGSLENLSKLTRLVTLDLGENLLESFDFGRLPSSVRKLRLSQNRITSVNMTVLLQKMFRVNSLESLSLRGNPIDCKCSGFAAADLKAFRRANGTGCDYVECFVCHWLKENRFDVFSLFSDDLRYIDLNRAECIRGERAPNILPALLEDLMFYLFCLAYSKFGAVVLMFLPTNS